MTKPKETKILALIAAILGGVHFLLDVMAIMFAELYVPIFFHWESELPILMKCIALLSDVFSILTVAGVSFWSYSQQTITVKTAKTVLIAQGIVYAVKLVLSVPFNLFFSYLLGHLYNAETLGFYSNVNTIRGFFSPLSAVALILICCSAAIELYITIHNGESAE